MKKSSFHLPCLLVLLFSIACRPAFAAEPNNGEEPPRINLDIPSGATLGEFLKFLREKYPAYGCAVAPDAARVGLGEMRLRGSTLFELCQILRIASGHNLDATADGSTLQILATGKAPKVAAFNLNAAVAAEMEKWKITDPKIEPKTVQAMLVSGLKGVIESTCINLGGEAALPKFELYPEGNVFIVIGQETSVAAATEIIRALSPTAVVGAPAPAKP